MVLPLFYLPAYDPLQQDIILDEDTSRHVVQVLRMNAGELLQLTDGKGNLVSAKITDDNKRKCVVKVESRKYEARDVGKNGPDSRKVAIAISLLKNTSRFEWLLEKATEIGITEIIPLICERTERQKFRMDRMQHILVSAMLQSGQSWLPVLYEPAAFKETVKQPSLYQQKFIAHCLEEEKQSLDGSLSSSTQSSIILIGPEGDFTAAEIELAIQHHFIPVTLGNTRLRTETAGVVAATLLKIR